MSVSSIASHERDWQDLAQLDPLYAILTAKGKEFGKWDPDEFFAAGQTEIETLMNSCGLSKGDNGTALDFGCGVGRLSRALTSYFGKVYGVDISEQMVDLAKRFTPSCSFVVNRSDNLNVFPDNSFDFIYSNIVLQHLPSKEMARSYIQEFIRIVKPGGLVVFQIPYKLTLRTALQPKRRLYSVLRTCGVPVDFIYKRLRLNPMRTISLSPDDVDAVVRLQGGQIRRSYSDNFNRNSMSYVATKS
jgi:SAM-dependent methyltransferase